MKIEANEDKMNCTTFLHRIVVKFHNDLNLPYSEAAEINDFFLQNGIISWEHLSEWFPGIRINKLFTSVGPEEIIEWVYKATKADPEYQAPDFLTYYSIDCPGEIKSDELLEMLLNDKNIELAYIQSRSISAPPVYANNNPLSGKQGYLNPAPDGIDARYAGKFSGGDGRNVKFIDIEQGWILDHEDIAVQTLSDTGINHSYHDHGAAVLGIIMMQDNSIGGIGIAPRVKGYVMSQWRPDGSPNTADAIMAAIGHLGFGDILLLEAQSSDSLSSDKVWPVEIHDAVFQVIRLATALGIIVIEAAGNGRFYENGSNDLDNFTLNDKNILNPASPHFRDSGAIIVAAASSTTPHTKMHNSTYGNRVNCYAWGEKVVTAGNYPRSSGIVINTYTRNFSGTSSASAIIAGAAIAVQSITEAAGKPRLSPVQMRDILSSDLFGTASRNRQAIDKIGVMPDLKKIVNYVLNPGTNKYKDDKAEGNGHMQTDDLAANTDIIWQK